MNPPAPPAADQKFEKTQKESNIGNRKVKLESGNRRRLINKCSVLLLRLKATK